MSHTLLRKPWLLSFLIMYNLKEEAVAAYSALRKPIFLHLASYNLILLSNTLQRMGWLGVLRAAKP